MEIVFLKHISKIYQQGKLEVSALQDINLTVNQGDFIAIVGASGSGKSTLLNIIGTLDTPTAGQYDFCTQQVNHKNASFMDTLRSQHLGFIFQSYNLLPVLSALENVEIAAISTMPDFAIRRKCAIELLQRVGLGDKLHSKPMELSGGQQQRVSVARALMGSPQLVLADEPTANLDNKNTQQLIDLMAQLNKDLKTAFLFSTHDERLLKNVDKILHISDGRIV